MTDPRSVPIVDITDPAQGPLTSPQVSYPQWLDYRDANTGTSRGPGPTITHLGFGVWGFKPTAEDEATPTVGLIDFGPTAYPRRVAFAIHDDTHEFWAVHVETPAGALWSGAAPTVPLYDDADGNPRTPPAFVAMPGGTYLYTLTPTAADKAASVHGRIDGPAGSLVRYWGIETGRIPEVVATPPLALTTLAKIVGSCRKKLASVATSRDPSQTFREHTTNHPFDGSALRGADGFDVTTRNELQQQGFGLTAVREWEASMVVRLAHAPFNTEPVRQDWLTEDVERVVDLLESHVWPSGTMLVLHTGTSSSRNEANVWVTELVFRVVWVGRVRST